jgi:hypothetical protein
MVINGYYISGYSIVGYWWLFYWWLLMAILLVINLIMAIGDFFIINYCSLFHVTLRLLLTIIL